MKNKSELDKIEVQVENQVKAIVKKLKETHEKFNDNDFGPTEADPDGAISFYGPPPKKGDVKPEPAGSKYPDPATLTWERPHYEDTQFVASTSGKGKGEAEGDDDNDDDEEDGDEDDDEEDLDEEFSGMDEDAVVSGLYTVCPSVMLDGEVMIIHPYFCLAVVQAWSPVHQRHFVQ